MLVGDVFAAISGSSELADLTWIKVIDQERCIGCHACTVACKSENQVPLGVTRTYVKNVEVGVYPGVRRVFQVTRCNQCDDPPCVNACPTGAMFRRPDAIVDFDKRICIGCRACIAACPYDAIFINPEDGAAEKCNFCAHRIDSGLEPACVIVCPVEAILIGHPGDGSLASELASRYPLQVRRPEKGTRPRLSYRAATSATLDPLAARRSPAGQLAWAEQPPGLSSGSDAADGPLLAYDLGHQVPWDWRVSLYTWTKGIAAGTYLVAVLLASLGLLAWGSSLFRLLVPVVGAGLLVATAGLLIWDLEHPERFWLILRRPRWRSWLARGAVVLSAYGVLLAAALGLGLAGQGLADGWLALLGVPLAIAAAVYTAYLFSQARGRDAWQDPLAPPHLFTQALLLGAAALAPAALWLAPAALPSVLVVLSGAAALHLLLVGCGATLGHATAQAAAARREMVRGRYRGFFWAGIVLAAVAVAAYWIGPVAAFFALAAVLAHEHAQVQAAQWVPLA